MKNTGTTVVGDLTGDTIETDRIKDKPAESFHARLISYSEQLVFL
jgi:hypothetical protein